MQDAAEEKNKTMATIIIIRYMEAGKTTVGNALAKQLAVMFYDLDW